MSHPGIRPPRPAWHPWRASQGGGRTRKRRKLWRAGVSRQRASMPVLGRVSERSGKQRRFLRPRRDLGSGCQPDREIDCRAGDQGNRRTFAPTGGRGLTVVDGRDQPRQPGDIERRCVVSSRCANGCEKWQIPSWDEAQNSYAESATSTRHCNPARSFRKAGPVYQWTALRSAQSRSASTVGLSPRQSGSSDPL
jgi:hypothetical protein